MVGAASVAAAKPDGYTVLAGPGQALFTLAPVLYNAVPYEAKQFRSVTTLYTQSVMLVVSASSPYRSIGDLTAALKAKGDKVTVTYTRSGQSHTVQVTLDSDSTSTNS